MLGLLIITMCKSRRHITILLLSVFGTLTQHFSFALGWRERGYPTFMGVDLLGWALMGWLLSWLILLRLLKEEVIAKQRLCDKCGAMAKSVFWYHFSLESFLLYGLLALYIPLGLVYWAWVRNRIKCQSCLAKMNFSHRETQTN